MKKTTVGRFWGYVSVFIALAISLAGNVTAAYLHGHISDGVVSDPTWVDLGFAGIPPLAAFLSVEIVNHNPWDGTLWGPRVRKVLLGMVAPASAVVSFIHLVSVAVSGREIGFSPQGLVTWVTAILTALLIDGLMFGGTAALLLPTSPAREAATPMAAISAYPDWRAEVRAVLAEREASPAAAVPEPVKPVVAVVSKPRVKRKVGTQKRFTPHQHPLWESWLEARRAGQPWNAEGMVKQMQAVMGREMSPAAATTMISRWEKAVDA